MTKLLNARVADAIDLQLGLKQAHWNLKGPSFIALHELLDSIEGRMAEHVDEMAERIVALGGVAAGTTQTVGTTTSLKPYPATITKQADHLTAVADRFADLGKKIRAAIDVAAEAGDQGTADLLTGVSRAVDKDLWFIEAHLA
jgi:starvation-inducible DNA-binding protein